MELYFYRNRSINTVSENRLISWLEGTSCQLILVPTSKFSVPSYLSNGPLTGTTVNLNTDTKSVRFSKM